MNAFLRINRTLRFDYSWPAFYSATLAYLEKLCVSVVPTVLSFPISVYQTITMRYVLMCSSEHKHDYAFAEDPSPGLDRNIEKAQLRSTETPEILARRTFSAIPYLFICGRDSNEFFLNETAINTPWLSLS
jgi:hypothetical protein